MQEASRSYQKSLEYARELDRLKSTEKSRADLVAESFLFAYALARTADTLSWNDAGAAPAIAQPPQLFYSADGNTFAPSGALSQAGTGWATDLFAPPSGRTFYVRVRSATASGVGDGSLGAHEDALAVFIDDGIFGDSFD